ncbi:MAG TPA: ribosome small subunit-dependent GTPase A [Candidatus Limnocylindrales bacterium]|nr:ribosome small subunit-dependent GTPase A [Candidatus Limnocylindrales bacterium]
MDSRRGLIIKAQSGFFQVEADDTSEIVQCRLRGRLMEAAQASAIAAIGDRVVFSMNEDGTGAIEAVEARHSAVSRAMRTSGPRGAGSPEREQVLIANADQALFVFAAAQPAPNPRTIDRFLVMGEKAGLDRLQIVLNKSDLDADGSARALMARYEAIGYPVLCTSAVTGAGLDELRMMLKDKISVFTGPSGVGKTSLLNQLEPGLGRAVKQVSRYHQEGQHTTRDSELVRLSFGGYLADTPGMRTLMIWDVEPEELDAYFPEMAAQAPRCRFAADCAHRTEPGCAVRASVEAGQIARSRYESYLALREELDEAFAL